MSSITFIHPEGEFSIPILPAITKLTTFQNNIALLSAPYQVQSRVSVSVFREFVSAITGDEITITDTNFRDLKQLSEEFGFAEISAKLSQFQPSSPPDPTTRLDSLERKVNELSANFDRLVSEVSALRSAHANIQTLSDEVSALKTQIPANLSAQVSTEFNTLKEEVSALKKQIANGLQGGVPPAETQVAAIPSQTQDPSSYQGTRFDVPGLALDSVIAPENSEPRGKLQNIVEVNLSDFTKKRFSLLWRGSRDGFAATDFHRTCDGHENTLTLIQDTGENIFGGYTPVAWESRTWNGKTGTDSNTFKEDEKGKSFLFTVKNPHKLPAMAFPLKKDKKREAIVCGESRGPDFWDLALCDNCNTVPRSRTGLGASYENGTGIGGDKVLAGGGMFQVREVEVFEISEGES